MPKIQIDVELTNDCNYNCYYCRNGQNACNKHYIEINSLIKSINSIKNISEVIVHISGDGEPTLHPDILTLVDYIYESNISCSIDTNGSKDLEFLIRMLKKNIHLNISWHSLESDHMNKCLLQKIKKIEQLYPQRITYIFVNDNTQHMQHALRFLKLFVLEGNILVKDQNTCNLYDQKLNLNEYLQLTNTKASQKHCYISSTGDIYNFYPYSFITDICKYDNIYSKEFDIKNIASIMI